MPDLDINVTLRQIIRLQIAWVACMFVLCFAAPNGPVGLLMAAGGVLGSYRLSQYWEAWKLHHGFAK